jgi:hypothetical protein
MQNIQPQVSEILEGYSKEHLKKKFPKPWTESTELSGYALLYCSSLDYAPCQLLLCFRLTVVLHPHFMQSQGKKSNGFKSDKRAVHTASPPLCINLLCNFKSSHP